MKLILLIIASDELEVYREEQKIWLKYMNTNANVKSYFIKGMRGDMEYKDTENTLYFDTVENLQPGIINKTIMACKKIIEDKEDFDYLIRTNLSSFFIFEKLITFISSNENIEYSGVPISGFPYNACSGAGIILSKKSVGILVDHFYELYDHSEDPDDLLIGKVLTKYKVPFMPAPRQDLLSVQEFINYNYEDHFHFRVKQIYCHPINRTCDEIFILNNLLKRNYPDVNL